MRLPHYLSIPMYFDRTSVPEMGARGGEGRLWSDPPHHHIFSRYGSFLSPFFLLDRVLLLSHQIQRPMAETVTGLAPTDVSRRFKKAPYGKDDGLHQRPLPPRILARYDTPG